ncbi:hypothetical protein [Brevundimonas vesicularis]|uniref:hypothetical protein n=1 Tax=Brevundimonas vesicularis TaxID=41276 RepID=UPI0038D4EC3F
MAQADPQEQTAPRTTAIEDIEVVGAETAAELRQRIEAFVEANMAPPMGRNIARWNKPVCIGTANLSAGYAQAVIDRIAQRIIEVGGDVQGPGCKVDIMVIGTNDGAAMARDLVKDDPRAYRPSRNATDRGARALEAFQQGDAPVRWWHVSLPVSVDTGDIAIQLDGEDFPVVPVRQVSRLRSNVRDDLARSVIIIDFSKLPGEVTLGALADYSAFVALAQVNPDGDTSSQDTILNLFRAPGDVIGFSQFDFDYLAALYKAPPNTVTQSGQTRAVASEMLRDRRQR